MPFQTQNFCFITRGYSANCHNFNSWHQRKESCRRHAAFAPIRNSTFTLRYADQLTPLSAGPFPANVSITVSDADTLTVIKYQDMGGSV